MLKKHKFSRKP